MYEYDHHPRINQSTDGSSAAEIWKEQLAAKEESARDFGFIVFWSLMLTVGTVIGLGMWSDDLTVASALKIFGIGVPVSVIGALAGWRLLAPRHRT